MGKESQMRENKEEFMEYLGPSTKNLGLSVEYLGLPRGEYHTRAFPWNIWAFPWNIWALPWCFFFLGAPSSGSSFSHVIKGIITPCPEHFPSLYTACGSVKVDKTQMLLVESSSRPRRSKGRRNFMEYSANAAEKKPILTEPSGAERAVLSRIISRCFPARGNF